MEYGQEEDMILLSNDPFAKELGKVKKIGIGPTQAEIKKYENADFNADDDEIIDYFLENNKHLITC